jgi:dimethylargininase
MFTHALVRTPGPDAAAGLTSAGLGPPDLETLLRQHAAYVAALRELGLTVTELDALPGCPDAYFVEDAALVFPELAILTRPGEAARRAEPSALAPALGRVRELRWLEAPATLDGGDVLVLGRTVLVGLGARTNAEGAAQVERIVGPLGYRVVPVAVPEGLHLKSSVTWAGGDVVVVTEALARCPALEGYRQLVVPKEEAYAANVLWINGTVLVPRGFPATLARVEATGRAVRVLDQSEVRKMDGALTCMSLRF